LGRSGQNSDERGAAREGGKAAASARSKNDGPDRPGASGHRFGPELACSECGILWDVHQREPKPCRTETVPDAFARRPSGDFEGEVAVDAAKEAIGGKNDAD
jgi:hypothetical protein